jgi:CIC family chloride channel protein
MLGPVTIGLLAAVIVTVPRALQAWLPQISWSSPIFLLGIAAIAMMVQRFVIDRKPGPRSYDGLADLFIHVHSPASPDSPLRWSLRGLISLLLNLFGGAAGPEGAATEATHALAVHRRPRSSRWFEQRRRSDAAVALAAGIAAAFSAPFAALLLTVELGLGGRTLSVAYGAASAYLASRALSGALGLPGFDLSGVLHPFRFVDWRAWAGIAAVAVAGGVASAIVIRFIRYSQESLLDLFQTQAWMRTLAGGILLFLVYVAFQSAHVPSPGLLEQVLWSKRPETEVLLTFFTQLLSLALVVSAFGTVGVFWPLFVLGGCFGYAVGQGALGQLVGQVPGLAPAAGLAGAAAFWGGILGAPLAGAVLASELTQNPYILLPCWLAGLAARQIRDWLRTPTLLSKDLEARGIKLLNGRSATILDALIVRDAMVTDHETVREQEPVAELHSRLIKSRYPFLPVVNAQGVYQGLLTVDLVQEGWQSLAKLLEAKDLLYRSGMKTPTVRTGDRLTGTIALFEQAPCLPVLGEDGRVQGLLFVHNVRLAYDRETARRSFLRQQSFPE